MTPLERALAEIRKRPSVRTPVLAAILDMSDPEVDALLEKPRDDGLLISCEVQVGGKNVREYRCSAGGVPMPYRVYQPPKLPPAVSPPPSAQERPDAPGAGPTQENRMATTIRQKIEQFLGKHGPMDSRSMRKNGFKDETLSQHLCELADRKILDRLGGGPRSTIYGLPGQKLPKPDALKPRAELGRKVDKGAPPQHSKPTKKAKAKVTPPKGRGRKALQRKPSRNGGDSERAPVPAGPAANGTAYFGINHRGELGITKERLHIVLSGPEFVELREFISRTQPVWKGVSA